MGSPTVPLQSWVYPLFDRLAALGYVSSGYAGLRPWTRMECARLLAEAGERLKKEASRKEVPRNEYLREEGRQAGTKTERQAQQIYQVLAAEFVDETRQLTGAGNLGGRVDSVYTRGTAISGPALRDGYHFGQTLTNDYARPYAPGFSDVTGITAHAAAGALSFAIQGEYQHAPATASDPVSTLEATAQQDGTLALPNGIPEISRFRLLESAAAFTYRGLQISFGKQSLWLGPGRSGPFLFSDNAGPIPMLRIDQTSPVRIPGISRVLGPARMEFFLGQVSGQHWIFSDGILAGPVIHSQPYLHGSKVGFQPTSNLEFGLGYTVLFGGPGIAFTGHNFLRTFTSFNESPGSAADPGDRRSSFDFSYRVPYLRNWLTVYADSLVEDEISPLGSTRPSLRLGLYVPRMPKMAKLDLRLEGLYTDVPGQSGTGFLYWNGRYRSGYTSDGELLASWIGRQGRGGQAWATYWLSPQSQVELNFRHSETDREFIGGGRLNDFGGRAAFMLRPDLSVSAFVQYEQWNFPALSAHPESNFTSSVQLTFYPRWSVGRKLRGDTSATVPAMAPDSSR